MAVINSKILRAVSLPPTSTGTLGKGRRLTLLLFNDIVDETERQVFWLFRFKVFSFVIVSLWHNEFSFDSGRHYVIIGSMTFLIINKYFMTEGEVYSWLESSFRWTRLATARHQYCTLQKKNNQTVSDRVCAAWRIARCIFIKCRPPSNKTPSV